jgi:hypothetical protein
LPQVHVKNNGRVRMWILWHVDPFLGNTWNVHTQQ